MMAIVISRSIVGTILLAGSMAHAEKTLYQVEADPLPFVLGGYGIQAGIRDPAWFGLRVSIATFSLTVPDPFQFGNDGFDLEVRPGSGAIYVLYYRAAPGRNGFTYGGSVRYLRLRYQRDDTPGEKADVQEIGPELIVGYQWHPFGSGFYVQPWFALGITAVRSGESKVGFRDFDEFPVSPFFTVNVGWELAR